ncbi:uncharacterized protein YslB [Paraliobacillus ryukyuensis]|uniref:Uncharacterized protein DUF2507 n=1 Tax=Paraliobacillus ryukyuensis TaxID=200904 RepID=A0A366ED80_9BACI|nr:YslB family protein [Paraliobacillus ryukyuensis]RBO99454.1 uncharacterized protein DUF2507 [Paraliobacillus ryukyuensis]
MHSNLQKIEEITENLQTNGCGYDLLRYVCLPDLLGKDATTILYVLGKNIARQLTWENYDQVKAFFYKTGWGELTEGKEKRGEHEFTLTGSAITQRMKRNLDTDYRLEAGILAEAMQQIKGIDCECREEIKPRKNCVEFKVIYIK